MILVDTSVWIDHLRTAELSLTKLLVSGQVVTHPFVIGELACGNLKNRAEILFAMENLPVAPVAMDNEILPFIERHRLMGLGIGYIDAHLLASAALLSNGFLWSRDKRLVATAKMLSVGYDESQL